ncbi:nucleotide exchange factor GrpE, partial [Adlercreutzia caecimuris]
EAAPAAASPADGTAPAEVIADAEVIEANEAGQLDEELEKAAAEAVAGVIEESEAVAAAKAEAADWQDKYVRLHAEWDTYRRRMAEQREAEKARAAEKLMESLLPVLDDFVRTVDYAETNGEAGLLGGVKAVQAKLTDTLAKGGLEVINPEGEAFDALACQAVGTVDDPSVPDETVAQVYQLGYRMGDKVLRPAMVTITTGGPKREKPEEE